MNRQTIRITEKLNGWLLFGKVISFNKAYNKALLSMCVNHALRFRKVMIFFNGFIGQGGLEDYILETMSSYPRVGYRFKKSVLITRRRVDFTI